MMQESLFNDIQPNDLRQPQLHKAVDGFAFVAYVRWLVCRQAMTQNPCYGHVPSSIVYNEDCVEALKRFSDNQFDLAVIALFDENMQPLVYLVELKH